MKKLLLTLSVLFILTNLYSQRLIKRDTIYPKQTEIAKEKKVRQQPETLFQSQNSFGGYFSFSLGYTQLGEYDAFSGGGRLMFVTNHYLGIGFGGKGIVSSSEEHIVELPNDNYKYYSNYVCGYGGLVIEPVLFSMKPVHLAFPVLIGGGAVERLEWNKNYSDMTSNNINSVFMIVEPGIDVEFNIAKWFRIGLGATYRLSSPLEENDHFSSAFLQDLSYGITFKMGYF